MPFTLRLRDRLRHKSDKGSSGNNKNNNNKRSPVTSSQDTTAAPVNNTRSIAFDFDNELTRQRALRMVSYDEETIASGRGTTPLAYSDYHRDSGVSMESERRSSFKQRLSRSRDVSPMARRSLSSSRSALAQMPRLSFGTDDGRRMSLGPAMEQWRLEEEEEWQTVRRNGESLTVPLTPALTSTSTLSSAPASPSWSALSEWSSRSPLNEDKGRRISLVAAMEQWRLEEDEDAKRTGHIISVPLTPPSIPASPAWPTLSRRPSTSSLGQGEGRRISLGPAMEQWRLEENEALQATKSKDVALPVLLPLESPKPVSKWPSQSRFDGDKGRRTSFAAAMERWRVDAEDWERGHQQQSDAPLPPSKPQQAWPSFGQGVHENKHATLGPAMEQWRLEELDEWKKDDGAAATPLPARIIDSRASVPMPRSGAERVMTLGPAMEVWRLEEVC